MDFSRPQGRVGGGTGDPGQMIDDFAIGLTHALMALAIWRLLKRTDLDAEPIATPDTSPDDDARSGPRGGARAGAVAGNSATRRRMRLNRA